MRGLSVVCPYFQLRRATRAWRDKIEGVHCDRSTLSGQTGDGTTGRNGERTGRALVLGERAASGLVQGDEADKAGVCTRCDSIHHKCTQSMLSSFRVPRDDGPRQSRVLLDESTDAGSSADGVPGVYPVGRKKRRRNFCWRLSRVRAGGSGGRRCGLKCCRCRGAAVLCTANQLTEGFGVRVELEGVLLLEGGAGEHWALWGRKRSSWGRCGLSEAGDAELDAGLLRSSVGN